MEPSPQNPPEQPEAVTAKEAWHVPLNKVTALSRILAAVLFIVLPFVGFWVGFNFKQGPVVEIIQSPDPVAEHSSSQTTILPPEPTQQWPQINWYIVEANPDITDENDYRKYDQAISVTFSHGDTSVTQYDLGVEKGCTGSTSRVIENDRILLGKLECYYALTGVQFFAYVKDGELMVERHAESAVDGSVVKTDVQLQTRNHLQL